IDDIVEATFEHAQQVLAGIALLRGRLVVIAAELALEQAVHALDLLLLAQLHAIVGQAAAARRRAMLAGLLLELALRIDRARRALEAEIRAFTARQFAGGSDITSHVYLFQMVGPGGGRILSSAIRADRRKQPSDAPLLRRPATVVRNRRHVDDVGELEAGIVQRTHRGLAPRARALDTDLDRLHAIVRGGLGGLVRGHLG